ncbi:hypothetical protein B0H34DRAFT_782882 [Crassisporium funariophilum]|nr:hypothetical protein B0H34DRAFT_782882 [Crassisporium funariophilum]
MATVAHYIYSHYDPEDREELERETGQVPEEVDSAEAWQKEASHIAHRQRAPPPQFVPATFAYDDWGSRQESSSTPLETLTSTQGNNLSGWYRSLTNVSTSGGASGSRAKASLPRAASLLSKEPYAPIHKASEPLNKNNWFIMKAIKSEPTSSAYSAPSLADILARDPPPLPTEGRYTPPVWLEIGPSNKGFGMLQRSGWNEGEALGPSIIRRKPIKDIHPDQEIMPITTKGKGRARLNPPRMIVRPKLMEVKMEDFDDVSELRSVDVIDLTLSDPDTDSDSSPEEIKSTPNGHTSPVDIATHGGTALLTPIATVLKSDKLGIGLKAKTWGPYKASQKRVTHNAAAMAAHVKSAEESRKRKQEHGGGHKGFEKRRRREEDSRKALLAYLKG